VNLDHVAFVAVVVLVLLAALAVVALVAAGLLPGSWDGIAL
jgi:hypothetical protein